MKTMDDFISRKALLERLDNRTRTAYPNELYGLMLAHDYISDAPAVEAEPKWIPVTERLPDADGCYIVTACDEGCSCGDGIWYDTVVVEAEHYKGSWLWNENGTEYDIACFVTHWMPLPQPPNEQHCICCGATIPEGQRTCPNCLVTIGKGE